MNICFKYVLVANIILFKLLYIHKYININAYCCFSYNGNWELVKSIVGRKFQRSYVCLHPQAGNRLWQLVVWHLLSIFIHFQNYSEMAIFLCYVLTTSVQKPNTTGFLTIQRHNRKYYRLPKNTEAQQENTTGFLRIQRHKRKILKRTLAKGNWNKLE